MPLFEAVRLALDTIRTSKLRSFFTLLGIIVSVGFLVAVVAIIQGMNWYVSDNLRGAMIGTNSFQVRRTPISMGIMDDSTVRVISRRPILSREDAEVVRAALPDAQAVSMQSGWPTPTADLTYRGRTLGSVIILGVTPEYQVVQDYRFSAGEPLTQPDIDERRLILVIGGEVAEKLFETPERAIGQSLRVGGIEMRVKGAVAKKGRVLGQSFDGFVLLPITTFESIYGRRLTTTVSVKMNDASELPHAMDRAEEAVRLAHRLRPGEPNDFTVDKADALVAFWTSLTGLHRHRGRRHRDHEHHADVRERAYPRDRPPQVPGGQATRYPAAVPGRGGGARDSGRHPRHPGGSRSRVPDLRGESAARPGDALVRRCGARAGRRHRDRLRRVPCYPRRAARPDRGAPARVSPR